VLQRQQNKELGKHIQRLVLQELNEDPYYKFKLVFALMGIIPLLTFTYIILRVLPLGAVSFDKISLVLFILITISLLSFLLGYGTIKKLLNKIIFYAAEIKRSEQLKADLVASVSHDFEIPVGVLKEVIRNLTEGGHGPLNETQSGRLNSCQVTLDNMSRTIKTLLDLYKIEAGMVKLQKAPFGLEDIINEKISEFSVSFAQRKIQIRRDGPKKTPAVNMDKDKIKEVINNIFSNFLKYIPEGGWLDISVYSFGGFVRAEFLNNSEFIPEGKLVIIFEKFKKLYEDKEGSGLGLAIAKSIIDLHGGNFWAENIPGKGVKFVIILPYLLNA